MIELLVGALPIALLLLKEFFAWRQRQREAAKRRDIESYAEAISSGDTDAIEDAMYRLDAMHEA